MMEKKRTHYVIPGLTFCVVLALSVLICLYRVDWVREQVSLWDLSVLGAGAVVLSVMQAFWLIGRHQRQKKLYAIEANLAELAGSSVAGEGICKLRAASVGIHGGEVVKGWNRLVNYLEAIRQDGALEQIKVSMGQLLCSYDSQKLLGVLDSLQDGVMVTDATGTVILANRSCEGLLGKGLGEFIGKPLNELFSKEEHQREFDWFLDHAGRCSECVFEWTVSEQPHVTVLKVISRRIVQGQQNSDVLVTIRDVTQQKISEAGRDDFVAHVSHELRSPLTNIRAYAETLLSDMVLDASTQKEAFNVINEETARLTRLINEVLDLSRLESGTLSLEKGEVVTDRLVRQCVNDVSAMASAKRITLQTNYHPKLPNLYADRDKLTVVIHNILSNAIKYTPEEGTVFVETNIDEDWVYIKITDTGYGIAAEETDRIFEKFYRVEREETADIPGSGLGLATSKEIVSLHGGTIEVSSELNAGTEMLVRLPLTVKGPVLGPANESKSKQKE